MFNLKQHASGDCGGFQEPKGHMDTQMYPECKGKPGDRDIVKKTREKKKKTKKKKKKSFNFGVFMKTAEISKDELLFILDNILLEITQGTPGNAREELEKLMNRLRGEQ